MSNIKLTDDAARQLAGAVQRLDRTPTNALSNRRRNKHANQPKTAVNYMSVSYDSVAEEFTVTFTNLPVYVMDGVTTGISYDPPHLYKLSQTLTFDKPAVSSVATFGVAPFVVQPGYATKKPQIIWSGNAAASNAATTFYKRTTLGAGTYTFITFAAAGTYTKSTLSRTDVPAISASILEETTVQVNSATSVTVNNLYDPVAGYDVNLTASGWTNPITTTLILARDDVDATCSLDIGTNAGNYDRSIPIGNIATDASGNYTRLELSFGKFSATLGWTGSQVFDDDAGNTHSVTVKNGLISNWTVT